MKVIIIEDNYSTRLTLRMALEKMGHSIVSEAEGYEDGFELIKKGGFDLLLLDLLIPGGNGVDLLKKVDLRGKKVIAVTALEQDKVDRELMELGVSYILRKPFSYEELEKAIKKAYE